MNKLLNNLLGMYKQAKLNKKAEQQNLKQIFEEAMGNREPIIETANGVFYFEPKGDKIVFGTATNVGISQDYVFDYDFDMSFDQNIQGMAEEVLEKEGYYTESSKRTKMKRKVGTIEQQINDKKYSIDTENDDANKLLEIIDDIVYDYDVIKQALDMTKNQKEDEFSIVTLSPEKDKVLGVKYIKKDEVYDYKPNQNEYALVMTRDTGFADTDYQLQPMIMVVRSWNEGRKFYATKKNRLNKKAEEDVEDVEDIEKWFSVKLNNDQAKEFTKLLTENNIKNKSKKEGEEIRVSFFLLPSSIGVAQGLLAATLSKFPDKQASTIKKAEEDLIAIGWGLYTYENNIKANAEDDGRATDREFWNKINNDIAKVESWFLKEGYKKFFTKVRDEGHGKDSELGGTAFVTEEQLKNFVDRAEGMNGSFTLTENSGALEFPIDYDETIFFELVIFVDEKILDDLNIESKKNIKNKKLSSKAKAMRKRADLKSNIEEFDKAWEKHEENFFKDYEQTLLTEYKGNLTKATQDLINSFERELPKETLYKLLKEYIDRPSFEKIEEKDLQEAQQLVENFNKTNNEYEKNKKTIEQKIEQRLRNFYEMGYRDYKYDKDSIKEEDTYWNNLTEEEKQAYYEGVEAAKSETSQHKYNAFYWKTQSSKNTKLTKKAKEYGISDYLNHFNDVQQYVLTENKGDLGKAVEDLLGFASSEYDKARFPREYVYKLVKEYIDDTIKFQEMIHHPIKEEYIVKAKELLNNYKVENKIASKTNKLHKQAKKESVVYYDNSLSPREDAQVHKVTYYDTTYNTWGDGNADHEFISVEQFEKETGKKIEELKEKEKITIKLAMTNRNRFGKKADLSKDFDDAESFAKKIIEENKHSFSDYADMQKLENNASSMYFMDNADIKEILDEAKKMVSEIDSDKNKKLEDANLYFGMKDKALLAEKVLEEKQKQEKKSSKAKLVRKQADEKSERVKKDIEKVVSEMDKSLKVVFRDFGDGYKIGKKEIEDFIKGTGTQVKVLDSGEYILVSPSGKEQTLFNDDTLYIKDNDVYIKQPGMFPKKLASSTKKQATIKHENGVYNVYSESGKCLGKGYKTKEEAEKRLKQVEYFKHKNASVIKKAKNLSEIDGDAEFMSDLEIGNGMPYNSDDYDYFEVYKIHAKNPKDTYNNKYVVVSDDGSILAVREKEEDIIEITYDDMLQELRWRRLSNRKTQPNKRTSLKQVVISKMAEDLKDIPDSVKKTY